MLKQLSRTKWAVYNLMGRCIMITSNREIARNTLKICLSADPA